MTLSLTVMSQSQQTAVLRMMPSTTLRQMTRLTMATTTQNRQGAYGLLLERRTTGAKWNRGSGNPRRPRRVRPGGWRRTAMR